MSFWDGRDETRGRIGHGSPLEASHHETGSQESLSQVDLRAGSSAHSSLYMHWSLFLLAVASLAPLATAQAPSYEQVGERWYRVDERGRFELDSQVISVRFRDVVEDFEQFRRLVRSQDPRLAQCEFVRKNRLGTFDLELPRGLDPLDALQRLELTGLVESCEENLFGSFLDTPNDPFFAQQKHLRNTGFGGGVPDADIDADQAWSLGYGDPSIIVAVLDSGCQFDHEDLLGALWLNTGEIPDNGIDDDMNGFIDDVGGWNFEDDSGDLTDTISHGTAVCGIVGARGNNNIGVAGVAGGFRAGSGVTVMPIKLATAVISTAIVDDAILYAVDHGARILNMSFEVPVTPSIDLAIEDARDNFDALLVAASGNNLAPVDYPARHPKVISVCGIDDTDEHWAPSMSTGSNSGPENWISASADTIWSTAVNQNYFGTSGTSFASPQVAATAALLLSEMPGLSADDLQEILRITADDVAQPGFDEQTGWGRLNLYSALLHVKSSDCNQNGIYDPAEIADGIAQDVDGDGVPDDCDVSAFCFGNEEGSACTVCPCSNSAPKGARAGCENASGQTCALLVKGTPSISSDTLSFEVEGALPNSMGFLCSADFALPKMGTCAAGSGVRSPVLDGLRCIGGAFLRHGARATDDTGESLTGWNATDGPAGGIALDGGFLAGQERQFQVFYLDDAIAGCGTARNTSNAVRVVFRP